MDTPERVGTHPLDLELDETPMLQWLAPTFQLLGRRFRQIAPFAAAVVLLTWLTPHIRLAGPFDDGWRSVFDDILQHALLTGVMMTGFAVLARSEGRPWGVGALLPPQAALVRVAIVTAAWAAITWVIGLLLREILSTPFIAQLFIRLLFRFDVYGVYLFTLIFSPLIFMLSATGVMAHIAALRGKEPIADLFVQSFRVVFGQAGRFVKSSLAITSSLLVVIHAIIKMVGGNLIMLAARDAASVVLIVVGILSLISLPWWFVMERALRPQLGVEDDLDPVDDVEAAGVAVASAPAAMAAMSAAVPANEGDATAAVAAPPAAPSAAELARARAGALVDAGDVDAAARELVAALRERRLGRPDFLSAVEVLPADAALLPELADLASQWQAAGRADDLAWLVRFGLKRDKGFLMDRPDAALAVARQLVAAEQPQPASHLLLAFVNRHRAHAAHRDAGLRLARLLAFRLDNVAAARPLIDKLAQLYPDDVDLAKLRAQLP